MTLFDLALKNIRRNMRSYALYIGATVFSIVIYFTFAALKYSDDMVGMVETSKQIKGVMSASAFILMIFVAIFIFYSNSFFMKKRKKEIALYSLLGVRKKSIGFLLFLENIVIGLLSLIIGVVLGFLLSRVLLSILLKLMGLNVIANFSFSVHALVNTTIVFMIIFTITSLMGYRIIYQFKLIDLFHAEKKGEEIPKAKLFAALIGILMLGVAYYIALEDISQSKVWDIMGLATPLVIITLTVIGSYLLFHSVLVYLLTVLKEKENWAWKGLRMMTTSQLLYRIKGNAKTLTIITVLSATTITAGGAVFGVYYNTEKDVQQFTPYTFMWTGEKEDIDPSIIESEVSFTSKSIRAPFEDFEVEYTVIDESTFELLRESLAWPEAQVLQEDEVFLVDAFYDERWSDKLETISVDNIDYDVASFYDQAIFNIETLGGNAIIMSDKLYEELEADETLVQAVLVEDFKNQNELSEQLAGETENFSSATANYKSAIEAAGSLLFVGSFLGLVFLVATGSIIFFKMVTEAEEDKAKYAILHKIGVSNKDMKQTIREQVGVIFAAPLLLGIVHGIVALVATSSLFKMDFFVPVSIWIVTYTAIYLVYYFITVYQFNKIIKRAYSEV